MRVYIAGPIAGKPDGNRPAFEKRARELKALDHVPVNPWDVSPVGHQGDCIGDRVEGEDYHRYGCLLRADIEALMYCDAISMLPGWRESRGASTEEHVARSLGLMIMHDGSPILCGFCDGDERYGPLTVRHKIYVHENACPIALNLE